MFDGVIIYRARARARARTRTKARARGRCRIINLGVRIVRGWG